MYTINKYSYAGIILASHKHLSQEEAYELLEEMEDQLNEGEQAILLEGMAFAASVSKR